MRYKRECTILWLGGGAGVGWMRMDVFLLSLASRIYHELARRKLLSGPLIGCPYSTTSTSS